MKMCELIIDDRGRACGRRTDVERVMVRGPGFTIPEPRLVCGRCRGVVRAPVVVTPSKRPVRPPCPVCAKWPVGRSGICRACRNALSYHCRTYPDRLPLAGTIGRKALAHIRPEAVAEFKQGAIILRLRGKLVDAC